MTLERPRGRPLRAVIDRSAFAENIRIARTLCPDSNVLVVIKADAYGHGMVPLARAAGDAHLAVATSDEASVLLNEGVRNTIWVLEGPFDSACLGLQKNRASLVWVVHSLEQLVMMARHLAADSKAMIWLKIDTGMHRLGFLPDQLPDALSIIDENDALNLIGVMTHFANSEVRGDQSVTEQIHLFDKALHQHGLNEYPQSLCNSAAMLNCPEVRRSWVRPGISLYGGYRRERAPYQPVMSLCSAVMALRSVPKGASVGYGGIWTAQRPSKIATVACGYGDGYPRHAPSGTPVLVNGVRAPLAGRVSMDMISVDVTDVPAVVPGSPVELWGAGLSIDEVASCADTISYELLTQVTARVPRIYL